MKWSHINSKTRDKRAGESAAKNMGSQKLQLRGVVGKEEVEFAAEGSGGRPDVNANVHHNRGASNALYTLEG